MYGPKFQDSRLPTRFWSKVFSCPVTGCWLWSATLNNRGYGQYWSPPALILAHRAAYASLVGPIPSGLQLDHLCRVRNCANPGHLEPVTNKENARRGDVGLKTGALRRAQTHCVSGHAFDDVNTYWNGSRRQCRECKKLRKRRARALRK